jgi:phage protein D
MDTCVLMSMEDKIATWPDKSDGDIVRQIVSAYNVQVEVDTTSPTRQANDTTIVQRGTDIQFVRQIAQRNGLEFYFETDKDSSEVKGYCRAPQLQGTPQPDLAIQFGEESNLRSFSARLDGIRPLNVKVRQVDVKGNAANTGQASSTQLDLLGGNPSEGLVGGQLASVVSPAEASAQMRLLGTPASDSTEQQTIAQAVRDEAAWFITATGEINSEAYGSVLRPRRLVQVKGAGTQYSGKYYVTRVRHQIGNDGSYTQTFDARRNARDLDGSEQFGGSDLGLPF